MMAKLFFSLGGGGTVCKTSVTVILILCMIIENDILVKILCDFVRDFSHRYGLEASCEEFRGRKFWERVILLYCSFLWLLKIKKLLLDIYFLYYK